MKLATNIICSEISRAAFNKVDLFRGLWLEKQQGAFDPLAKCRESVEKSIRDMADDLIAWRFGQVQQEMEI